jgi:hypothetical protein
MKTPEEKALEIFNSMKGFRVKHSHSKKCALKAVKLLQDYCDTQSFSYWSDVEQELNKIKTP